jgi:uncharacterized membrane protein YbaN (DUF454 family)
VTWIGRAGLIGVGCVCVVLGVIGIIVPGMPTTVFVIAASYCFARSCPVLDQRLHASRWLGPPLRRFRDTGGMSVRAKATALVSMWIGIGVSCYWLAERAPMAGMAAALLGCIGTFAIVRLVRTIAVLAEPDSRVLPT